MNERIKELYNQCFVDLKNDVPNVGFDFEKFAELIVRECAYASWISGNDNYKKILDYFEVK